MLTWTAERCGGFDWQDEAFDAAYDDIEHSLFGTARSYAAIAPLVGLSGGDRSSSAATSCCARSSPASSRGSGPRRTG